MLVDRRILAKILSAAYIGKDEIVLEVGAGQGVLTSELYLRQGPVKGFSRQSCANMPNK